MIISTRVTSEYGRLHQVSLVFPQFIPCLNYIWSWTYFTDKEHGLQLFSDVNLWTRIQNYPVKQKKKRKEKISGSLLNRNKDKTLVSFKQKYIYRKPKVLFVFVTLDRGKKNKTVLTPAANTLVHKTGVKSLDHHCRKTIYFTPITNTRI